MPSFIPGIPADCPPDDAVPATDPVYRIVKTDPPTAADFLTPHETGRLKNRPPCLRCALSVYLTLQDAVAMRDYLPVLGNFIAVGEIADLGVAKLTEGMAPSHTTWWPFAEVDRHTPFKVVR
jgi:hypothetical protein